MKTIIYEIQYFSLNSRSRKSADHHFELKYEFHRYLEGFQIIGYCVTFLSSNSFFFLFLAFFMSHIFDYNISVSYIQ